MKFYTYSEIADIFKVKVATVRVWKSQKLFKVAGYRRLGKWAKEALVHEDEVKILFAKKNPLD